MNEGKGCWCVDGDGEEVRTIAWWHEPPSFSLSHTQDAATSERLTSHVEPFAGVISNWHHHANLFLSKLFPMRVAAFWGRVDIALSRFSPTWPVIPLGGEMRGGGTI